MTKPKQLKYDGAHLLSLDAYARKIKSHYIAIIKQVAQLNTQLSLNPQNELYLRNHSEINRQINALLEDFYKNVYGTTISGINSEWDRAVEKNNAIAKWVFGTQLDKLPQEYKARYLSNNAAARDNFIYRKQNGLGLSDKVWNNTRQFKKELELSLEVGLYNGKSAESIARDTVRYLNDPDMLFRRVREKPGGTLRLSKAAQAYNPGQGRYRSSYKNAFRLARNEINFSYEGSQHEKRQQQDFIVGVEIRTSPNHNPADDKGGIRCIDLEGRYPKDFDFTYKWHVNCKCMSLNIMKNREELDADTDLILAGKKPTTPSVNQVNGKPGQYTKYVKDNSGMWENWKNKPRTFSVNR